MNHVLNDRKTLIESRQKRAGMTVWDMMFVCFGLYFVFGRFLVDIWVRRGIRYAVTDRRILISRPKPFERLIAIGLHPLPEIGLDERSSGRGTIRFGSEAPVFDNRNTRLSAWTPSLDVTPRFIAIDDARRVFDLIYGAAASPLIDHKG